MPILHTSDFRPGCPEEVDLDAFEQWLKVEHPDRLESFGRARFPRWWSCWARIRVKPAIIPQGWGRR